LNEKNGRSISLWPHGVLFRDSESDLRRKMIEEDLVECVIGLGPNLFYNSPMEACLLITKTNKSKNRKNKILFINAILEVKQEKTMGFLEQKHIDKIYNAYQEFESIENFAALITCEEVLKNNGNMSISLYARPDNKEANFALTFEDAYNSWNKSSKEISETMSELFQIIGK
jgi:type I restriction enzyme M protein